MGTNTLADRGNGQTIDQTWYNDLKTALDADLVPRSNSGVPTDLSGNMGQSSLRWLKAFIASGYWSAGDIKAHHSFNGAAPAGEGWMLMDGRVINQTNYDAEHGAGSWAAYIGSSPLDGKYLPDMVNSGNGRYPVGVASTSQDGSAPVTAVGTAAHSASLAHSHNIPPHNHKVYAYTDLAHPALVYDSSGNGGALTGGAPGAGGSGLATSPDGGGTSYMATRDMFSSMATLLTDSQLSTVNIQPDSIAVQYYMRII